MTKLADLTDIPVLEGWINFTEAAERLGYTRSYMYKMAKSLKTVHKLGNQNSYVVSVSEIDDLLAKSKATAEAKAEAPVVEKPARKPRAKKEPVAALDIEKPAAEETEAALAEQEFDSPAARDMTMEEILSKI